MLNQQQPIRADLCGAETLYFAIVGISQHESVEAMCREVGFPLAEVKEDIAASVNMSDMVRLRAFIGDPDDAMGLMIVFDEGMVVLCAAMLDLASTDRSEISRLTDDLIKKTNGEQFIAIGQFKPDQAWRH